MERLDARMKALAELTSSSRCAYSKDGQHQLNESWRTLLPAHNVINKTDNRPVQKRHSSMQSWHDHSTEDVDGSQDIFLGPNDLQDMLGFLGHEDDERCRSPIFGNRADLFVRRPSPSLYSTSEKLCVRSPIRIPSDSSSSLGNCYSSFDSDQGKDKPKQNYLNDNADVYGALEAKRVSEPEQESCLLGNDRDSWPTSSRQSMHFLGDRQNSHPNSLAIEPPSHLSLMDRSRSDSNVFSSLRNDLNHVNGLPSLQPTNHEPLCIHTTNVSPHSYNATNSHTVNHHDHRITLTTAPNSYCVRFYMPGFSLDGITLTMKGLHRRILHILANKWGSEQWEHFERRIVFAQDAQMSLIRARFENEQLIIQVPRKFVPPLSSDHSASGTEMSSADCLLIPPEDNRRDSIKSAQF